MEHFCGRYLVRGGGRPLNLPYRCPDPQQEDRRRAEESQQQAPRERWAELAARVAFGWKMVANSPRRRLIEQRMQEQEAQAQRIQRELFRRHG